MMQQSLHQCILKAAQFQNQSLPQIPAWCPQPIFLLLLEEYAQTHDFAAEPINRATAIS